LEGGESNNLLLESIDAIAETYIHTHREREKRVTKTYNNNAVLLLLLNCRMTA
jgi:hypothetical protein